MEDIIVKIKKLLAFQEDATKQGSLEEAANAAQKVQTLLLKHNLERAEVEGHSVEPVELHRISSKEMGWDKRQGSWMHGLYSGLCTYNFCSLVLTKEWDDDTLMQIMGEPQNLEVVEYMGETLARKLLSMQTQAWKNYEGGDKKGTFRRGYLMGATMGIISKIREQREQAMEQSNVQALVLVKSKKVEEFKDKTFQNLTKTKVSRTSSTAVGQGYRDGRNVNINQGVGQSSPKGQING